VAICAHGDSSKYSADYLRNRGFDAVSLTGGMDAWSELYVPRRVTDEPLIYQINRVARGCFGYVIISEGNAVVIDVSRHTDIVRDLIHTHTATVSYVVDTHLQADHLSGGRFLAEQLGTRYCINSDDADGATYAYTPLSDGEEIAVGRYKLKLIHSPGHTPGSTSLLLDHRILFAGDTIMKTSIGRPDLGGEARNWGLNLHETLFTRFSRLPDETRILPSHSVPGISEDNEGIVQLTLGEARATLDLFQSRDADTFLDLVERSLPENPSRYQDIRKANLGQIQPDEAWQKELEIGKNLCGMEHSS